MNMVSKKKGGIRLCYVIGSRTKAEHTPLPPSPPTTMRKVSFSS